MASGDNRSNNGAGMSLSETRSESAYFGSDYLEGSYTSYPRSISTNMYDSAGVISSRGVITSGHNSLALFEDNTTIGIPKFESDSTRFFFSEHFWNEQAVALRITSSDPKERMQLLIDEHLKKIPFASVMHNSMQQYWVVTIISPRFYLDFRVFLYVHPLDRKEKAPAKHTIDVKFYEGDQSEFINLLPDFKAAFPQMGPAPILRTSAPAVDQMVCIQSDEDEFGFLSSQGLADHWRACIQEVYDQHLPPETRLSAVNSLFSASLQESHSTTLIDIGAVACLLYVLSFSVDVNVSAPPQSDMKQSCLPQILIKPCALQALYNIFRFRSEVIEEMAADAKFLAYLKNVCIPSNQTPLVKIVEMCRELKDSICDWARLPGNNNAMAQEWANSFDRTSKTTPKDTGVRLAGTKRPGGEAVAVNGP